MDKKTKKYVWIGIAVFAVIAILWFVNAGSATGNAILELDTYSKNLGDVSQATGVVSTDFVITNTGNADLEINGMDTSCMCTSAQVVNMDREGPIFGMSMHGNPTGWSTVVKAGESATLRVFYDPNMHRNLKGPVSRTVSIFTNAGTQRVQINLNQVA